MMVKIPIVGWMLVTERVHRVIVFRLEIIGAPVTDSVLNCWCKFPILGWNPLFFVLVVWIPNIFQAYVAYTYPH